MAGEDVAAEEEIECLKVDGYVYDHDGNAEKKEANDQ